jgi:hypothetical protein
LRILMKFRFVLLVAILALPFVLSQFSLKAEESCFDKSLHHTGQGMRYWYEAPGGFMDVTKIPYDDLDCKTCHVQSCDPCHTEPKDGQCTYSSEKAKSNETCTACHTREALTLKFGKEANALDVHFAKEMSCSGCHGPMDVHGEGKAFNSMRDPGAVDASCSSCHEVKDDIRAHQIHTENLDCAACHVKNTTACMNCHFDGFLATGSRKGMFFPLEKWTMLVNYEGKVTTGTVMSIVYKDNKFLLYAPYFSHSVQKKGRQCSDCHANAAALLMKEGKTVPMIELKEGKITHWEGVVPTVPEKLSYVYFNKSGDKWVPIKNDREVKVQFVGHGQPLSEEQLKKLYMTVK